MAFLTQAGIIAKGFPRDGAACTVCFARRFIKWHGFVHWIGKFT